MWPKLLWIGGAGALGALARYGLGGLVQQRAPGSEFPWGTLAVNLSGCLLFGFLWAAAERRLPFTPEARLFVFIGFLGAFTTFSTFAYETGAMLQAGQWWTAAGNILAQNAGGILCLLAGMAAGRLV